MDIETLNRAIVTYFKLSGVANSNGIDGYQGNDAKLLLNQAAEYCENVKKHQHGWRMFLELLKMNDVSTEVKFFCLQTIQRYLENSMDTHPLNQEEEQVIRVEIMKWTHEKFMNNVTKEANAVGSSQYIQAEPKHVRGKLSIVIALLIKRNYPEYWPNAFDELLSMLPTTVTPNSAMLELFLRVLRGIDEEVVGRRGGQPNLMGDDLARSTKIKDTMRETVVPRLIQTWMSIIAGYYQVDASVTLRCLKVIELYTSWIDIGLLLNETYLQVMQGFLSIPVYRSSACTCLTEVVQKGMDPLNKLRLIQQLGLVEVLKHIVSTVPGKMWYSSDNGDNSFDSSKSIAGNKINTSLSRTISFGDDTIDDDEFGFTESVAKLANSTGIELLRARREYGVVKQDMSVIQLVNPMVDIVIDVSFRIFTHESFHVQEHVLEFFNELLQEARSSMSVEALMRNGIFSSQIKLSRIGDEDMDSALLSQNLAESNGLVSQMSSGSNASSGSSTSQGSSNTIFGGEFIHFIPKMVYLLLKQSAYPLGHAFSEQDEDEDEAEFDIHRKEIKRIFVNITRIVPVDVVLPFLASEVQSMTNRWMNSMEFRNAASLEGNMPMSGSFNKFARDIEALLNMVYNFGEGATTITNESVNRSSSTSVSPSPNNSGSSSSNNNNINKGSLSPNRKRSPGGAIQMTPEQQQMIQQASIGFMQLIIAIHSSGIVRYPHHSIVLIYNELTARYANVLSHMQAQDGLVVLLGLSGNYGISYPHSYQVRSRACYLLLRIVRCLGPGMAQYTEPLLRALEPHLSLPYKLCCNSAPNTISASSLSDAAATQKLTFSFNTEPPPLSLNGDQSHSASPMQSPTHLSFEDIKILYEVVGILIAGQWISQETTRAALFHAVSSTLLRNINDAMTLPLSTSNMNGQGDMNQSMNEEIVNRAHWVSCSVAALVDITKGFNNRVSPEMAVCFKSILEAAITALGKMPFHPDLHRNTVTLLHRMVRTLDDEIMPFLPAITASLISREDADVVKTMYLFNQLAVEFKRKMEPAIDSLFIPIMNVRYFLFCC